MQSLQRRLTLVLLLTCGTLICVASAQAGVQVSIGQNFTGISYGISVTNSGALPPDNDGDVGPNDYVEFINGMFVIYDKTDLSIVDQRTDADFWAKAGLGVIVSDLGGVTDPRIIFDPVSQRWFASEIDFNFQIDDNFDISIGTNNFLLAVSRTADPNGQWKGVSFPTDPNLQYFGDFPTLGVDTQGVYMAADMYDSNDPPDTGSDVGCTLVCFAKSNLLVWPPVFTNRTLFENMPISRLGQIYQPVTCADGSATGKMLAAGDIGNDSNPHSNVVTFTLQNVAAPGAATLGASNFVTVPPYMVPYNPDLMVPLFTALQPDGTQMIQANDARFSARAYTVGGVIYGVNNTELNGKIAIRWYRLSAADGHLLEAGTIADTNMDLYFPSIAANRLGTVMVCYNGSGLSNTISCYASAGQTLGGVTSFGSPILLHVGAISYHGDDEDPTGLFGNPVSRWGDYSATSVDPSDSNRFWTIQEFPSDTNVWSTQITELITTLQLKLSIRQVGTNAMLSWPSGPWSYQLLSATNLMPPVAWSNVTQPQVTNATQVTVSVPISPSRQFFRLQQL
jgi:hypothetical protein